MQKYVAAPAIALGALGAALLLNAGSASAADTPTEVCESRVCLRPTAIGVDSDGDGFTDTVELAFGTDANDPNSHPRVLDVVNDIVDGSMPDFWLKSDMEIITVGPDGTSLLPEFDFGFGLTAPSWEAKVGLVDVPGVDVGGLGDLDWDIHDGDGSGSTAPPDAPNNDLIADGPPPTGFGPNSAGQNRWTRFEEYNFLTGMVHQTAKWVNLNGTTVVREVYFDGLEAEEPVITTDVKTNADGSTTTKKSETANGKTTTGESVTTPPATEEEKEKGYYDQDFVAVSSDPLAGLNSYQAEVALNAAAGGEVTNSGDTGIDLTGVVPADTTGEVIHTDPDAGEQVGGSVVIEGGVIDFNEAQPEADPNLPMAGDVQGGFTIPGGNVGAPGDRG